ncbi:hypothetical protein [Lichenifustis flavocetrariae]|uniref:Uncharacterized protein n=1 Tax=Lichenifustis flavocetrariae TaxID=2949735 RepID=A0AA41YVL9_9HYPH|nr:hypothetical protein [Lichenifustis flavocetrariae]MCW6509434.1 hypothetical protein [Lichenifustis flavocetrariae]
MGLIVAIIVVAFPAELLLSILGLCIGLRRTGEARGQALLQRSIRLPLFDALVPARQGGAVERQFLAEELPAAGQRKIPTLSQRAHSTSSERS